VETSNVLCQMAESQVFSAAVDLMRQLDSSVRERQKSLLFQQRVFNCLPDLRRSLLLKTGEVYNAVSKFVIDEFQQQHRRDRERSLNILRQGRHLAGHDKLQTRQKLESMPALLASIRKPLSELEQRLWPEQTRVETDAQELAFRNTASS
jgi:hypothetical protein